MSTNADSPDDAPERRHASLSLLAEELEPESADPAVRARLLAQLRGPERWLPFAPAVARELGLALEDAQDALRRIQDPTAWRPGLWPGSQLLTTPSLVARSSVIARLPAGMRIPHHRHQSRERTYILDGELSEDGDIWQGAGSLVDKARESEHAVTVSARSDCLVVFSVSAV